MRDAPWPALAALLAASVSAQAPAPEDAARALRTLRTCSAVETPAERLACYDRAIGRNTPDSAPRAAAGAPAAAPPPRISPAPATSAAVSPKAAPAPVASPAFGLYAAEHPAPPPAPASLTGRVQTLGRSSRGRPTVTLDDGGLWELDDGDPLLAVGDIVTIRRAALHSFLLETPSKRQHRALRLR